MKQVNETIVRLGLLMVFLFTLSAGSLNAQDKCKQKLDKEPFPVGGLKTIMKNVEYPDKAKKEGIQGKVIVTAVIDAEGNVIKTSIEKSDNEVLNDAALKAVKNTKFTPGEKDGKKVKAEVTVPIMFKLS
ncbi:MAG: energy transducer TonB [Melioribacteraceae bacterium]|nr:energy transducer TonB [Melioribacteraceae bacterium]